MNPQLSSIVTLKGTVPMENCPLYIFREKEKRKGLKCLHLFLQTEPQVGSHSAQIFTLSFPVKKREENLSRGYEVSLSTALARG